MGKVDTITFDKTGTITLGKLEVSDVICTSEISKDELIKITASIESKSEHPLAKSIVEFAKNSNLKLFETSDFKMQSGKGVVAKINFEETQNEKIIFCGNEKFLEENNFSINQDVKNQIEKLRVQGKASILVATKNSTENIVLGIIALSDVLRPEVSSIISKLEKMKVESVLLTGDNEKTANYFAKLSGLKKVFANLLPEQKVQKIIDLQNNGKIVCMIGDGVNDAPALKTASVGISMASMGSDIAVEASDIALMSDDITKIPYLKKLSVATVKTIKFSISLSMFINFLGIVLSVLGLLNPTTGALVHNAGSVFVVMFAAFLYEINFDK
jgi:P-type E1-E2 ATPase